MEIDFFAHLLFCLWQNCA